MSKIFGILMSILMVLSISGLGFAQDYNGNKVLFIDSYHEGYAWSDGITDGIKSVLDGTGIQLKIIRMDTKRNTDVAFKKAAALKAKAEIEAYKPDVVIAADDNASKFLIEPYYKNASLPFVFCGVNWDAAAYGYPYTNATGMVEVTPIPQLIEQLQPLAKGDRVGFIAPELLTARKEAENYKKVFGMDVKAYFAKDFEDWKKGFAELQDSVDILLIASDGGLYNDHKGELVAFVESNTKIPTGAAYDFMAQYSVITFAKVAEEQGAWSAKTALEILAGTSPSKITIVKNKEGKLIVNTRIAKVLGADVSFDVLAAADHIIE